MEFEHGAAIGQRIARNVERVIVGKPDVIERALVALIVGGHVLFEDVPGVGKTMMGKALNKSIGCSFKRIQFTPDLLPSDVTGVSIYSQKTGEFSFRPGPIFANIVLADEINRASPRTQSSLLECMEEGQVTVDGITHELPSPFLVIATENPIEYEGIYPLPESQLDRFLMRLNIGYPEREDEKQIVKAQSFAHPIESIGSVADAADVTLMQEAAKHITVSEAIYDYMLDIVRRTRDRQHIHLGASPRGSLALMKSAQALALLQGRDYVAPDDVKVLAPYVLAHRLILDPQARIGAIDARELVVDIVRETPIPEPSPTG